MTPVVLYSNYARDQDSEARVPISFLLGYRRNQQTIIIPLYKLQPWVHWLIVFWVNGPRGRTSV